MNPYQILGVSEKATEADIKSAFRRLAKQCHPDHHPGNKAKEEQFKKLSEAYELLSVSARRAQYDQQRAEQQRTQAEKQRHASAGAQQRQAPPPRQTQPAGPRRPAPFVSPPPPVRAVPRQSPIVLSSSQASKPNPWGEVLAMAGLFTFIGAILYGVSQTNKDGD